MSLQEWVDKLAKDERAFVLVYNNQTNVTLYLIKDTLTEGKYDNPPSKEKKPKSLKQPIVLEAQATVKFGIRGKKKETELSHKWIEEDTGASTANNTEFLLSLQVPPGAKGRAAHVLSPEGVFNVKKTANWKIKPPQITVTLTDPNNPPAPKEETNEPKEMKENAQNVPPKEDKKETISPLPTKEEKKTKRFKKERCIR